MTKPDWFVLIEQWKAQGMGELGPTLPFLVGAIAYKREQKRTGLLEIQTLLDDMVYRPMDGYSSGRKAECVRAPPPAMKSQFEVTREVERALRESVVPATIYLLGVADSSGKKRFHTAS